MTPHEVMAQVATAHGLTVADIVRRKRRRALTRARIETAHRLVDRGFAIEEVASIMRRNQATVRYLLGIERRKPKAHSAVLAALFGGLGTDE